MAVAARQGDDDQARDHRPVLPERGLGRALALWRMGRREQQDPEPFYRLLAEQTAATLERRHGSLSGRALLDLGCGPGYYTDALRGLGAEVTPADSDVGQLELAGRAPDGAVVADAEAMAFADASFDGVFCSNLLEHTPNPLAVITEIERVLRPGGWAYVSWTNWYSPWGGHDMIPYQYLGPRLGPRLYHRRHGPPLRNDYGDTLWAVHVGPTLRFVRGRSGLVVERVEPRYWPRLAFLAHIPLVREILMWNCVIHLRRV